MVLRLVELSVNSGLFICIVLFSVWYRCCMWLVIGEVIFIRWLGSVLIDFGVLIGCLRLFVFIVVMMSDCCSGEVGGIMVRVF